MNAQVCSLGRDPKYICWKSAGKTDGSAPNSDAGAAHSTTGGGGEEASSDEEEEEEVDEAVTREEPTEQPAVAETTQVSLMNE